MEQPRRHESRQEGSFRLNRAVRLGMIAAYDLTHGNPGTWAKSTDGQEVMDLDCRVSQFCAIRDVSYEPGLSEKEVGP